MAGDAREEFAQQFDELVRVSELQAKQVVSEVMRNRPQRASWTVTAGLVSAWRRGRNLPSKANEEAFPAVVRILNRRALARTLAGQLANEPLDVNVWSGLLENARGISPALRELPGGDRPVKRHPTRQSVASSHVVGRGNQLRERLIGSPIERLSDPFKLGVHRSIDIDGASQATARLPLYRRRAHDGLLEDLLTAVTDESTMVVLFGDSSTGKTRAWWEALKRLPAGWLLYSPLIEVPLVRSSLMAWSDRGR